jgi:hypothetical protein
VGLPSFARYAGWRGEGCSISKIGSFKSLAYARGKSLASAAVGFSHRLLPTKRQLSASSIMGSVPFSDDCVNKANADSVQRNND